LNNLEVLIRSQQRETVLACDARNEMVELRKHLASSTQLIELFGELRYRGFVGGPESKNAERCLQSVEVLSEAPA
jgi:hypothetical protein